MPSRLIIVAMYHLWLGMKTSQVYTGLVADMYDDFVSYRAPVALRKPDSETFVFIALRPPVSA